MRPPGKKNKNILPPRDFAKRVFKYTLFAVFLLATSLGLGVAGYHYYGGLGVVDSFYNASMILTGMGPVDAMKTDAAKTFASMYALFSGVVFLSTVALFFSPFAHRIMHLLHVDDTEDGD